MSETVEPGVLYIVSTPIGNLEDITLRAIKVLGGVDLIAAEDTRKTKFLLDHLKIAKPLLSYFSYNEARRTPDLIGKLTDGKSVALVTDAGTPGISDPAYALIKAALDAGLKVVPIPGASAVLPALIVSGLPTDRFVFEGFLPVKKGRRTKLEELRSEPRTIVIYESPFRIVKTVEEIQKCFGDRRIAVVRELTKKFEEVIRGTAAAVLEELRRKAPRGEYVLVIEGCES
ncbi:MAG: rsmI [Bacteroidetes bacterium]|nr:rsmI [Bacteroidota bacterium]